MRPVTNSFLNTVRAPHKAVFRARLCSPGQVGVNPVGSVIPVVSGDATFDVNSDVNGTMDMTYTAMFEDFDPYGDELYVERGVEYANGVKEYVGLGYYRVNTIFQENVPEQVIRVSGEDRMSNLRDGRVPQPIQFGSGASVAAVLDFLVQDVMPTVTSVYDTVNWPGGTAATTLLGSDHILSQDRLKFIQELVSAYGKICYFDYAGRFVVRDAPDPRSGAAFTINAGQNGVLSKASRSISRDGVYNGVVASGEPAGELPPVYGIAIDDDPASPTFWGGPFGKVPKFFASSFLTTPGQCANTALNMLNTGRGAPYTVSLGLVPNPALEGWDVVEVIYPDGTSETHICETLKYTMSVEDEMEIDTRKQYLI